MKRILLVTIIFLIGLSLYANTQSIGIVYSLGIFSSTMSDGIVVGNGKYVLTNKNAVFELTNKKQAGHITKTYGHINKYPLFLSNETGNIYECETIAVLDEFDLALIKLPVKMKYTNKIETDLSKFPSGTFEVNPKGKKFNTKYIGLDRNDETGEFFISEFESKSGELEKGIDDKKFYMCDVDKNFLLPGGMLLKDNKFYGILNIIVPLVDLNQKPEVYYTSGKFSLGTYILDYCKKNNIDFENTETVEGNSKDIIPLLNEVNYIISTLKLAMPEKTIEAVNNYSLADKSAYINILKGMAYEAEDKTEEAIKTYDKALEIDPNQVYAQIRKHSLKGDKISLLNELSEKYPHDSRIYDRLARFYGEQKNYEMARSFMSRALIYSPNDPEMLLEKAKYEKELKNHDGIKKCIIELNNICPRYLDLIEFETQYMVEINDPAAENFCQEWVKISPKDSRALTYMAQIYLQKGDFESADKYITSAKENDPDDETKTLIKNIENQLATVN